MGMTASGKNCLYQPENAKFHRAQEKVLAMPSLLAETRFFQKNPDGSIDFFPPQGYYTYEHLVI